ncbi:cytochrome-c oxidase, cbb3-type subunit III [Teichococcus oryzae]|uniref:Cbb3-type cytochrome c oxidase subunit n=1 Tax=Teichococcus oryzae TaxID=1608942 RepID=A0A5B2TJA5_9PROT|nr:cytochrome-c oxidase, cbb3-type subunit III [Pseudoroseomonas oryzae]KAA2213998.1 cytochrome-c oxidase, cbb3-type subunit III [Pseudoroseomonas oryzae]
MSTTHKPGAHGAQKDGDNTTGHEWDGIRELNTPLPTWWLYVFYATIAFALVWVLLYPAFPGTGWNGLLGRTARTDIAEQLAADRAQNEPVLARLRGMTPAAIIADPELRDFALAGGRVAFGNNCAGCHGAGGQGAPGFPSLADDEWLWGGKLADIQHSIEHGIRAPDDENTRMNQMPRFLADGMLTQAQVNDVAEHVLSLSGRAGNAVAAGRGAAVFAENCAACHGEQGQGNQEMGAPALNDAIWLYGGDKAAVVRSVSFSRAGVMPAWATRLDPATIRMLVVYLHALGGTQE